LAPVKVEEKKYLGECECGCGTDLYGFSGHGRKMYVNSVHGNRARRQRAAAGEGQLTERRSSRANTVERSEPEPTPTARDPELVFRGKCACGCGSDVYGSKHAPQMKYVNSTHQIRANNARQARRRAASSSHAADPQKPLSNDLRPIRAAAASVSLSNFTARSPKP
jgi:hypothetical protein